MVIQNVPANERGLQGVLTRSGQEPGRHHVRRHGRTSGPDAWADESPWHQGQSSVSSDGAQSAELIKLAGDAAEGSTPRPLVCRKRRCRWAQPYDKFKVVQRRRSGLRPPTYDATNVLIAAIQSGQGSGRSSTPSRQRRWTASPARSRFEYKGDIKGWQAVTVFQVKGGSGETVEIVGGPP